MALPTEACSHFQPNQWRKTICKNCFRGFSEHAEAAQAPGGWKDGKAVVWYDLYAEDCSSCGRLWTDMNVGYTTPAAELVTEAPSSWGDLGNGAGQLEDQVGGFGMS